MFRKYNKLLVKAPVQYKASYYGWNMDTKLWTAIWHETTASKNLLEASTFKCLVKNAFMHNQINCCEFFGDWTNIQNIGKFISLPEDAKFMNRLNNVAGVYPLLGDLQGIRCVWADEVVSDDKKNKKKCWNQKLIKLVTGGGKVPFKGKFKNKDNQATSNFSMDWVFTANANIFGKENMTPRLICL